MEINFTNQIDNLLGPSTQAIGKIIAKPFLFLDEITTKENAIKFYNYIVGKLSKKNKKNLPIIEPNSINLKTIYKIINDIRFSYDDNSIKTELSYAILFKLITQPSQEEEEFFDLKLLDNLYSNSLHILYLIDKSDNTLILEENLYWMLKDKVSQEIKASEYVDTDKYSNYIPLDYKYQNSLMLQKKFDLIYNNINVTDKLKYMNNLQEYSLIYSIESKNDSVYKYPIFFINNQKYITQNPCVLFHKYIYKLTDKGKNLLANYYQNDDIENIIKNIFIN
jgi:hypothetical protein